jgi:hypothetical protein
MTYRKKTYFLHWIAATCCALVLPLGMAGQSSTVTLNLQASTNPLAVGQTTQLQVIPVTA